MAWRPSALANNTGPDWREPVAEAASATVAAACGGGVGSSAQRSTSLGRKVAGLACGKSTSEPTGGLGDP